jgi:hypothetical protein
MPLRDHFRPPVSKFASWEGFHGMLPMAIVQRLAPQLPDDLIAEPRIRLGTYGVATATWAPPEPTLAVDADPTEQYAYEVLIFDLERQRELVAAVEIVSPANKDRPANRRAMVAKCAAMLQNGVCISIVDLVTTRKFNLYVDLLELIGQTDPAFSPAPATYAVTCRGRKVDETPRFESWAYPLVVGQPLATLPVWLSEDLAVSLDLEASYEDACKALRIT